MSDHHHKDIAILYHGGCPDGFGAAYAAWKKFGDTAEYIPVKRGEPIPEHLDGKKLFLIDFSYSKDEMDALVAKSSSLTALDHHRSAKETVESMPEYVYDEKRSGATIAWDYFHPDTKRPRLLNYVEDGDLYLFKLPDARAVLSYVYAHPFQFDEWDRFATALDDDMQLAEYVKIGTIYAEHFNILVEQIANRAVLVSFEGYECYFASTASMFNSDVGHLLASRKPPIGIVATMHGDALAVSLRSDPSVDVSVIATKYGGGGHPQASGFLVKWGAPLPWTVLPEENENTGH